MPWPRAGRKGLVQEGSFASGFKGCARGSCLGAQQTEEAGGQVYGISLSVVAGNGQLMPRKKAQRKDSPFGRVLLGKAAYPSNVASSLV